MTTGAAPTRQDTREAKQLRRSADGGFQRKRRSEALQRQAEARRSRTDHARNLAIGRQADDQPQDTGPTQVRA